MINIERIILSSVLQSEAYQTDSKILALKLNPTYFTDTFNKKISLGIERLKELDEPICYELLRKRFKDANKWTFTEDEKLIDLVSTVTPAGSEDLFMKYYGVLEKDILSNLDRKYSL